jgi:SAM-dependent methyltransferase
MNSVNGAYPYLEKKQAWSSHWYIRRWLAEFKPGTKVLDIGASSGMLGRAFSDSGFFLTGLEPNAAWAELARPYYQSFWEGSIEDAPREIIEGQDAVILADVLEHLSSPSRVLEHLIDVQPDGCVFLISVPNIANISVRLNLLFGRFDYQERGILDQTHLRFFTRRTFFKLLKSSGLDILECRVTPIPLALVNPFFEKSVVGQQVYTGLNQLSKALPTILGYQFVVKAQKPFGS